MDIKYRALMKEYGVTFDSAVLDPAFVSKAKAFEEKIKSNQLTDPEIEKEDAELVDLFNKHELSEEDSDEVKEVKHAKEVSDAKAEIAESGTIESLTALQEKFKLLPEVQPVIDKKLKKLTDDAEKIRQQTQEQEAKEARSKLIVTGRDEIANTAYEDLQSVGEKYKDYPELVEIIKKRHVEEKPKKDDEELAQKLLAQKEWSYKQLEALGVKPTGNDMTIAGVKLEKEFILNIYTVRR